MMHFNPAKPYNGLPPLPPQFEFESKSVLRKAVTARAVLAELNGISETIPESKILINFILMQETKDSSEIIIASC